MKMLKSDFLALFVKWAFQINKKICLKSLQWVLLRKLLNTIKETYVTFIVFTQQIEIYWEILTGFFQTLAKSIQHLRDGQVRQLFLVHLKGVNFVQFGRLQVPLGARIGKAIHPTWIRVTSYNALTEKKPQNGLH
jgi:hypothetical protein